ncbi:Torsin-1B [Portunus trituberculatus]|uniref:Torsin-1B n=2 Tax=Portunus trituberculatus TaxID=210409 RepID=A0A5B7GY34_PORTR|nr:Torsin-1B [Portunus trituberculatus]
MAIPLPFFEVITSLYMKWDRMEWKWNGISGMNGGIDDDACLQTKYTPLPVAQLQGRLRKNLVGQSLAIETIIDNLSEFSESKPSRPLVLWFSGRKGSGKTLAANVMSSVLGQKGRVQAVVSSHLPEDQEVLQQEAELLIRGVDPCAPNFLVIDGWDGDSLSALGILKFFLKGLLDDENLRNSNVLVVLSGTRAARGVEEHFLDFLRGGRGKEDLHHDFTNLSIALQDKHLLSRATRSVVLVPFLPMDAVQVRRCVTRELLMVERWEFVVDEVALAKVQQQVLDLIEMEPGTDPPLAALGCGRVSFLLTLLLPHLQEL